MSVFEMTIWVDERLASWLSTQATRNNCLRHRYIEKALAKLMEDQLSESRVPDEETSQSSDMPQ